MPVLRPGMAPRVCFPKAIKTGLRNCTMWAAIKELYSNVVAGEERTGVSLVENVETRRAARTPQPGGYAHAAG